MSELLYLYGFLPTHVAPPPLRGMADAAVHVRPLDAFAAAYSLVPNDEFAAERIEQRLERLEWVAEQGIIHERVVSWFVDHGDIVPVPLFTLYSGQSALERDAHERRATIAAHLTRLAGRREWDLKMSYAADAFAAAIATASEDLRRIDEELATAAPGRRFLLEKRRGSLLKQERQRVLAEAVDRALDTLRPCTVDLVRLAVPKVAAELPVIAHAALLVDRLRETELDAAARQERQRLEPLGIDLALSGPWAPYRFVRDDEEAAGLTPPTSP